MLNNQLLKLGRRKKKQPRGVHKKKKTISANNEDNPRHKTNIHNLRRARVKLKSKKSVLI